VTEVVKTETAGTVVGPPITAGTVTSLVETQINTAVRQSAERLNVVVILLDDVGREEIGWYGLGADVAPTPRLDGFRAKGVTFTNAYAYPICGPTRAAVHTGVYGKGTGLAANIEADDTWYRLADSNVLLPEILSIGCGVGLYARGTFGKWHMCGYQGQDSHPFDNGYARFFGCIPNAGSDESLGYYNGHGHFRWRKVTGPTASAYVPAGYDPATYPGYPDAFAYDYTTWDASTNVRDALAWINTRTTPFICYLPLNPPHSPFERPPNTILDNVGVGATGTNIDLVSSTTKTALDGAGLGVGEVAAVGQERLVFKANLEAVDTLIGLLYDRMDPTKRASTVFVVWGDNGTPATVIQSPYDPLHAKRTLYEQGLWVPALIFSDSPVITAPNRNSSALVHAVDLCRTIGDLCLVDWSLLDETVARDSISLVPILRNPSASSPRTRIYAELFSPLGGPPDSDAWYTVLSDGTYKVFFSPGGTIRFFRIGTTPGFSTGLPGYREMDADDYMTVSQSTWPAAVQSAYATLSSEIVAVMAEP
jgi:arylsulfatase A-like enzyme